MTDIHRTESDTSLKLRIKRDIVQTHGTPIYVLDIEQLDRNYADFVNTWAKAGCAINVFYSVKTNYLPIICRRMRMHGAGADVVSGHEIAVAVASGFAGTQLVLNGPMKTAEEIERIVDIGGIVNIDAIDDIPILEKQARRLGRSIEVGMRINPGISPFTHGDPSVATRANYSARRSKFGWPVHTDAATRVADLITSSSHLRLAGLHCQIGSQVTDTDAFLDAIDRMLRFAADAPWRSDLRTLNIGGGFGVPGIDRTIASPIGSVVVDEKCRQSLDGRQIFDLNRFVLGLLDRVEHHGLNDLTIACEPGRVLVSDAMSLLTTVISVKDIGEGVWVILDGGVNLLPTAGIMETHRMDVVGRPSDARAEVMVAGPLCYDQDIYSYNQYLPNDVASGDIVEIHDAGAYSISRATSFIRGRAPVVATLGSASELCWKRESADDIFAPAIYTRFDAEADK